MKRILYILLPALLILLCACFRQTPPEAAATPAPTASPELIEDHARSHRHAGTAGTDADTDAFPLTHAGTVS